VGTVTTAPTGLVTALEPGAGLPPSDAGGEAMLPLPGCEPVQIEVSRSDQRSAIERARALAAMTHELRTPLNAIIGFAQLLAAPGAAPLTARQRRYIAHIEESGHHLLSLINEVLDVGRVSDGRLPTDSRPAQLRLVPPADPDRSAEFAG
jgi:signal transduction histidine kinase